jgi:allantoinase
LSLPDGTTAVADLVCSDGRIGDIVGPNSRVADADEEIDVTGLHLLPGVIDPHVHTRDPGATHKEDLEHASRAAAAGGITTIFEMPNTVPPAGDATAIDERRVTHPERSVVNIGLWGLVLGHEDRSTLRSLAEAGAVAGKLFWGYFFDRQTGALVYDPATLPEDRRVPPASIGDVRKLFTEAAAANFLLGIHCEDRSVLDSARTGTPAEDYEALLRVRPTEAETVAIAAAIELAATTSARIHILHISSARGVDLVRRAKQDGLPVTAETCPHYLSLTAADYEGVGSALKIFPPVRRELDRQALLAGVQDGTIDSIGSDHAPHSLEERAGSFATQPAGAVAVETMLSVLLDLVAASELSLAAVVRALTWRTADLYRVAPRKGRLEVGADADVTAVDLSSSWTVDAAELHSKARMSPWHGRQLVGRPKLTVVGGQVAMRDGHVFSDVRGRFVEPLREGGRSSG